MATAARRKLHRGEAVQYQRDAGQRRSILVEEALVNVCLQMANDSLSWIRSGGSTFYYGEREILYTEA
jgi:hypothetical protein